MPFNLSRSQSEGGLVGERGGSAPSDAVSARSSSHSRSRFSRTGSHVMSAPIIYAPEVDMITGSHGRVSDVIRKRFNQWKPTRAEIYTALPKTRYGMTCFPDTRHC